MIWKVLKFVVIGIILVFGLIQFSRPDFVNPEFDPSLSMSSIYSVPDEVQVVLNRSCADCHSNTSEYPWYSNVAPISWGMYDHIRMGRADLNFDDWGNYDDRRRKRKLDQICEEIQDGVMPHYQYLWLHWDASLSANQKKRICQWTEVTRDSISKSK